MIRHIPNFITSLNLTAGFISIVLTLRGDIVNASWLILVAMIFDFLDGLSARLLKAYSDIGKELDSLADVVSFGVAPAIILYQLLNSSLATKGTWLSDTMGPGAILILLLPAVMPVCAALRLAKFNIDDSQTTSFKGLPTPANALAVVSLVIAMHFSSGALLTSFTNSASALIIFTIIISLLMVTRIPMLSLKMHDLKVRGNEERYILITSVLLAIAFFGAAGAVLTIPLYIAVSLISTLFRKPLVVKH